MRTLVRQEETQVSRKSLAKNLLGQLPWAPELYWLWREHGNPPMMSFSLHRIERWLPELCAQAEAARRQAFPEISTRRILIFASLRYWIEHATLLGLALSGLGHQVTLLYLPFSRWQEPISRFDARRLNAYARKTLQITRPLIHPVSVLELDYRSNSNAAMPENLAQSIQEVSLRDTQYTLQVEKVNNEAKQMLQLRRERNTRTAYSVLKWLETLPKDQIPEVLITPNGSILEMGAVYQVARTLNIPTVTYEFGEQRGRIWLARNAEVMHQDTDNLWEDARGIPLSHEQLERIHNLYASRQNAQLWDNFARLWQGLPGQGGEQVRANLGLDSRPVVLLAANVIGDSLTLGRQIFTRTMTEWLERTVKHFSQRQDAQLVVRIHPGERYTTGPSVARVVENALSTIPDHVHLVKAEDPINTYDLIEIADLGLVYTTTVGMEMAMSGVPVIVAGETHYRGKGFSLDPNSWDAFVFNINQVLSQGRSGHLSREQVELAWRYAYRFYFDYPCAFPWHLLDFWKQLESWSLQRVLSPEGLKKYGDTFRFLAGEPRVWNFEAA